MAMKHHIFMSLQFAASINKRNILLAIQQFCVYCSITILSRKLLVTVMGFIRKIPTSFQHTKFDGDHICILLPAQLGLCAWISIKTLTKLENCNLYIYIYYFLFQYISFTGYLGYCMLAMVLIVYLRVPDSRLVTRSLTNFGIAGIIKLWLRL